MLYGYLRFQAKINVFRLPLSLSFGLVWYICIIVNALKFSVVKSFGSILTFTSERNEALLKVYKEHIGAASFVRLDEIGEKIVNSPSPRFWVSEERAAIIVSAIMRGKPVLETMRPTKREMFEEIYRRVIALKGKHPNWHLCRLVFEVVNSPAPKFYMEASSALERLYKIRNGRYNNRKE